jgi:hypothetical protein
MINIKIFHGTKSLKNLSIKKGFSFIISKTGEKVWLIILLLVKGQRELVLEFM